MIHEREPNMAFFIPILSHPGILGRNSSAGHFFGRKLKRKTTQF